MSFPQKRARNKEMSVGFKDRVFKPNSIEFQKEGSKFLEKLWYCVGEGCNEIIWYYQES